MLSKCPGAQIFRQPKPEDTKCPFCGREVEIWTDEIKTTCPNCKKTVTREQAPGCIDWCRYAKECVGEGVYTRYMKNKTTTVKQKLLEELEEYFGNDKKRIEHARKVMRFAEKLLEKEEGDWHIVIPTSILHDVGIKEAEKKYGEAAPSYQEKEGPSVAKEFLLKMSLKREDVEEICEIIAHHHSPGKINTQNFKLVYDADCLVNLKDEINKQGKNKLERKIEEIFLTDTGKNLARKLYLKDK